MAKAYQNAVERVKRMWRDRVAGPALRTYDTAVAELGGVRWREHKDTDAWFLGEPPAAPPPLPSDISIPLLIARRTLAPVAWLGLSAGLLVLIAIGTVAARSGAAASAATLPAAPAVVASAAAPAAAQVAPAAPLAVPQPRLVASTAKSSAPVAPRTISPSVNALFNGGVAASAKHGKVVKHAPAKKTAKKKAARAGKHRNR